MNRILVFFLNRTVVLYFLTCIGLNGCSQKVRVSGRVIWESGNQMPSPDLGPTEQKGFQTTVYFFEPFKSTSLNRGTGFFRSIHAKEKARVLTNKEGYFRLRVLPGTYSVLIAKDSVELYASIQDGEGFVQPYPFKKGKKYDLQLKANWNAVY